MFCGYGETMIEPYSDEEKIYVQKLIARHKKKKKVKYLFLSCVVISLVGVSVLVVVSLSCSTINNQQKDFMFDQFGWSESTILTVVEEYIRPRLRFPTSGVFSDERIVLIEQNINYNCYFVTGSVESLNSFGSMIRQSYSLYIFCYAHAEFEITNFTIT